MRAVSVPAGILFGSCRQRSTAGLGLLLATFGLCSTGQAQPDIRDYVSPVDPVETYLEEIDNVEADFGPYALELADLYIGLGQTLIEAGEYERARDAYHRGVLVQRVNHGPNSPEQTNHLYLLANLETLVGENESADKVLNNIYFANMKHYGEDSAEMLPVLKRIFEWYAVARPLGTELVDYGDYARNIDITEEIVRVSELVHGETHPLTATAYRRLGEANFQTVMYFTGQTFGPSSDNYITVSTSSMMPGEMETISVGDFYSEGRQAFKKYREALLADESLTPSELANELAKIGDWYMMIDKFSKSVDHYEEGYQTLAAHEEYADQALEYMRLPEPMHFVDAPIVLIPAEVPADLLGNSIEVSMTVTNFGSLRDIEILNVPIGVSSSDLKKIRQQVLKIPFRPAMREGEVVTVKQFRWQYVVVAEETAS